MPSSASSSTDDVSSGSQPKMQQTRREGPPQKGAGWFPLSYKEGFSQWWSGTSPAATEHRVLSFIPYLQRPPTHGETGTSPVTPPGSSTDLPDHGRTAESTAPIERVTSQKEDPYGPRTWHSNLVQLSGKNRALNEFSVERTGEDVEHNLVMLHGYGAGLGFFYKNFEKLSRAPGWKLYALDMLGMGRSTRPTFTIHAKDRQGKIAEAESWFVDALEEWRIERKIERFTLLGHSMGGYMAVAYALKYPGHLNKLILASPVGIPEDPYAVSSDLPEPGESAMINEFTQDQDEAINGPKNPSPNAPNQPPKRPYSKWLTYAWDANISPFSIVRWAGPLGPRLVSGWTSRRFSHLPPEEAQALHDYSYSLFRQRGSGEYALAYILAPGAFARSPLIRRIQGVGRQYLQSHSGPTADGVADTQSDRPREQGYPVVLMYGEHDWMDVKGGYAAKDKIKEEREKSLQGKSAEERAQDQGGAKVTIIHKAGHHVYLDGFDQFNNEMLREMQDVEKREKSRVRA